MAYTRRTIVGGAVGTTITGNITSADLAINIAATTGWPTGSPNGDFFVVINRGGPTEEKVRCASRTAGALTVQAGGRGADGSSAAAHFVGESIEICITATDGDEANYVVSQTVGLIAAAGDLLVGSAVNTLSKLAKGANGTVLRTSAGAVGWNQVTAAELAAAVAGNGLTGANGSPLAVNVDNATIEIATNVIRVKDAGITYAKIQNVSATARLLGRATAGAGVIEELTAGASLAFSGTALQRAALTGDVTAAQDSNATALGAVVNNTKMASGFRANTVGAAHPGSPVAGDLDYDTVNNLLYVYNGTSWVCITPQSAVAAASQTTTSTSFTAVTGAPSVTIATGTKARIVIGCYMENSIGQYCYAAVAVSGATTIAAAAGSLEIIHVPYANTIGHETSREVYITGLTPGNNTFTLQNKTSGGTMTLSSRSITAVGVP